MSGSSMERLWAGWRERYVNGVAGSEEAGPSGSNTESFELGPSGIESDDCVMCRIVASPLPTEDTYVLWRSEHCLAVLNAYPYTSGHLMVLPLRHVASPEDLEPAEGAALWAALVDAMRAVRTAYAPAAFNLGANVGKAAGAGVPGHLHLHCLPRWVGDTNFMTTVAEARVLPESLGSSFVRLRAAWPAVPSPS